MFSKSHVLLVILKNNVDEYRNKTYPQVARELLKQGLAEINDDGLMLIKPEAMKKCSNLVTIKDRDGKVRYVTISDGRCVNAYTGEQYASA
jgi:hypothetical protein